MNKVEITGVNTSRLKTLPESEKTRLLLLARQGDPAAREQLVSGNLRLVLSVVQKFAGRSENPDDLFQVGCIGLIKAIDHFDPAFDVRFSTYAVPMIVGEIRRYLRDNNAVRVSRSLRDTAYKAMQSREALTAELHREPSSAEIAQDIGGMIWRLWSLGRLARQRDASALAYMNWKDSLTSIIRWTLPFSTCGWRENPLLTVANFVLHIGILLAVLFYSAHNVMWDYNFGFSLPSLPDGFMDAVTLATILACLVLGWRRLAVPASSYVTRQADWFSLLLVTGVMVTGFASAHGFGSESFMALLHVLFGEAILICLPFTRLSHAILIPFTRAYMGSESIGVRRTCDW